MQKQLEKYYKPFNDILREQQSALDYLKDLELTHYEEMFHAPHLEDILSIAGMPQDFLSLQTQIENNLGSITSISSELELLKRSSFFESVLANQENLYKIQEQYSHIAGLIELPSERIESVLAAVEASSRLWNPPDFYHEFALSFVKEYQDFVGHQFNCLKHDSDRVAERRLETTELSGDLFELISASREVGGALIGVENRGSDEALPAKPQRTGFYGHVNKHLSYVYTTGFSGDVEASFNRSTPARIASLGSAITEQIYRINSISEIGGKPPIFKPTTKIMQACALIPSRIATNETDFNILTDYFYFLLYEGSGEASRLTSIVSDNVLQPLWKVKHLRLSARHDIDHGSRQHILSNRIKIKEAFLSLIGKNFPLKHSDWKRAQLQLYEEIDFMLQAVLEVMKE
jgi:hypothetical protein